MNSNENNELPIILIAEDDLVLNRLIQRTLKQEGYELAYSYDGKETINQIIERNPDLILLDYQLPDLNARDVIQEMKTKHINVPFVIMTGNGDERIAVDLMKMGAKDYLIKDNNFIAFLPTVVNKVINELRTLSALKYTESILRESERRYSDLFENTNDIVYTMDLEGYINTINSYVEKLLGYKPTELIGRNFSDFATMESQRTAMYNMHRQLVDKESHLKFEIDIIAKNNSLLTFEINSYLRYHNNNPVEVFGIARDITERKKIDRKNKEYLDLIKSIYITSPDPILITKCDGEIVDMNHKTIELLHVSSKNSLIGHNFFEKFPKKEKKNVISHISKSLDKGATNEVESYFEIDNKEIKVQIFSSIVYDSFDTPTFFVFFIKIK